MGDVGRPTKFKDEYCEQITDWLSEGKTIYNFCLEIGVTTSTFHKWRKDYPQFSDSIKDGEELRKYWAEEFVKQSMIDSRIQPVQFVMYCRNYLKLDTKDKEKQVSNADKDFSDAISDTPTSE